MKNTIYSLMLGAVCGLAPASHALTSVEADNLLFLKQEEKLARDVYQVLYAQWGHVTFLNISASEQQHMDAVNTLIVRYGVADSTPAEPGKFSIPALQELYDQLVASGGQSLESALAVGVLIEETDIEDITAMLAATQRRDLTRVLTNLRNGSYNHLSAFNDALQQLASSAGVSTPPAGHGRGACGRVPRTAPTHTKPSQGCW